MLSTCQKKNDNIAVHYEDVRGLWYQPIDIVLEKHLNGKKHLSKLKDQEKSTVPKMNFIITDPAEMPYYCVLCQVSCSCQKNHEKHLAGMKHAYNANREKYTWKASNMKK